MGSRSIKTLFSLFLALLMLAAAHPAQASPLVSQTERLFGKDRIETAIKASVSGWQQAQTVILARADDFPDSLVAVPLSHSLDAPILLNFPGSLDAQVLSEIKRLGANHVVLLGGAGIFGTPVTGVLEQVKLTWERIGGKDRYETATIMAEKVGGKGEVILASGENFPDALAIGAYAGIAETPILLTTTKALPQTTLQMIGKFKQNSESPQTYKTLVIGGEGVIPNSTLTGVGDFTRIWGQNRYETAAKAYWYAQEKFLGSKAYLVTGENFPDALVAGALAAKQGVPVFMSDKANLPAVTYSAMGDFAEGKLITFVGGAAIISDGVRKIVEGTVQPPYLLAGVTVVIDPGHGGPDPGAIGFAGSKEKDNTLPVGLFLTDLLRSAGSKVILTRDSDVSPAGQNYATKDLQARVDLANNAKADLFISIHNNSASVTSYGQETWYSADNPQTAKSQRLANAVQGGVVNALASFNQGVNNNRGVKEYPWFVTKNTLMPAVLVELGFLSNPIEEKLLGSADFQNKAALGIYRGVLVYKGY